MQNILIIYNEDHTNIDDTLTKFNNIHPNIKYTIEKQENNKLNYLDTTIVKTHGKFTFNIIENPSPQTYLYTMTHVIRKNTNTQPSDVLLTESTHTPSQTKTNTKNYNV
jgi:hypothetical protein